jgi:hypothetical protein
MAPCTDSSYSTSPVGHSGQVVLRINVWRSRGIGASVVVDLTPRPRRELWIPQQGELSGDSDSRADGA